ALLQSCCVWSYSSFFSFFFFSSRRRHTRFSRDWSSDVCSSDLYQGTQLNYQLTKVAGEMNRRIKLRTAVSGYDAMCLLVNVGLRSEERRVGKECRSRGSPYH